MGCEAIPATYEVKMKLHVLTIVYNGMPFLARIYEALKGYVGDVHWVVVEGPSNNGGSTGWCQSQEPGQSTDGTCEFLHSLEHDPRVTVMSAPLWPSKDRMVNAGLSMFGGPGVLLQVDSDEAWSVQQLLDIVTLFTLNEKARRAYFECSYWVGKDIVVIPATDPNRGKWLRAWRYEPGMKFDSHEPPVLAGNKGEAIPAEVTARCGMVFDHFSYCTAAQVRRKCAFYGAGYEDGLDGWHALQRNTKWPTLLKTWMPWCPDGVMAERVKI